MGQEENNFIPAPRRKRTRYGFSNVEFVAAWETSNTVSEAAEKLTIVCGQYVSDKTASDRAAYLWKKKVPLKRMRRVFPSRRDDEQLNLLFHNPVLQAPS